MLLPLTKLYLFYVVQGFVNMLSLVCKVSIGRVLQPKASPSSPAAPPTTTYSSSSRRSSLHVPGLPAPAVSPRLHPYAGSARLLHLLASLPARVLTCSPALRHLACSPARQLHQLACCTLTLATCTCSSLLFDVRDPQVPAPRRKEEEEGVT